ncbi:MAG: zinc ABC transporter substrate-binding protein [Neomegalonema sp.]|nr:zinc ABC transporter substrate-binding protein [Neomegalonema sp.]
MRPSITRRRLLGGVWAGCTIALAGMPAGAATPLAAPLAVTATTGMIADALRAVGGEGVSVRALMGSGVDPHSYRQTRKDIAAMVRADAVFHNGLYLEAQLEDFLHALQRRQQVVALGEAVPVDQRLAHQDYEGRFDPHVWMDPMLWSAVVAAARDALSSLRPAMADVFAANSAAYLEQIAALHRYSAHVLASVPSEARVLVTAHDAFSYFSRAYGYEVLGVQGISTESEAGLARIRELVDLLVMRKVRAVFVETSVSDRNVRALIEGAAARGHRVEIGGALFSDAMGRAGRYEGTYLGMIDHNVTTITRALGGSAPIRGWQGLLQEASA